MGLGRLAGALVGAIPSGRHPGEERGPENAFEGLDEERVLAHVGLGPSETRPPKDHGGSGAPGADSRSAEGRLGKATSATELIHGDADRIHAVARQIGDVRSTFERVGNGLQDLLSGQWEGKVAEAFREKFAERPVPEDWLAMAEACGHAVESLTAYAGKVTWAQGRAQEALDLFELGQEVTDKAVAAYNQQADAYNEAMMSGTYPGSRPAPFEDPGTVHRQEANTILGDVRKERDKAAWAVRTTVRAMYASAPAKPSDVLRALSDLDNFSGNRVAQPMDASADAVEPPAELIRLEPTSAPELRNDWTGQTKDPSEGDGRLVPAEVPDRADGAGTPPADRIATDESTAGTAARRGADAPGPRRGVAPVRTGQDSSVDAATGAVTLTRTDIAIPGTLPLVFRRRTSSDHRAGLWLGPTWTSTVDQRLVADAEGLVLVDEEGTLTRYPHPAPGVPVLPVRGPLRPLDRTADGSAYTLSDPRTGRVMHFAVHAATPYLPLVRVEDRGGDRLSFEYDASGAPTAVAHSAGHRLTLTAQEGRITGLHLAEGPADDKANALRRYRHREGRLTDVAHPDGRAERFAYDADGRLISWSEAADRPREYVYDDRGRCVSATGEAGGILRFSYADTDGAAAPRRTEVTAEDGAKSVSLVDGAGRFAERTDPRGGVTRWEFDRHGEPTTVTDPLGRTTAWTYDAAGHPTSLILPDGRRTVTEYDRRGMPVRIVAPDGGVLQQTFDSRGNRTSSTDAAGATTRLAHDEDGRRTTVTDARGAVTRIETDASGLLKSITDPMGAVTRYERDVFGRPLTITDPLGAVTRLRWTAEGRLSHRTEPDGAEQAWTYDAVGNCTAHTDQAGRTAAYQYTPSGLLAARVGPDGARHAFTYDTAARLTTVTDPRGLRWTYDYDPAGNRVSETDWDGRRRDYTFDLAGDLTARTDSAGVTTRLERDEAGRVIREVVAGAATTYTYDAADRLVGAEGDGSSLTVVRDGAGRAVEETCDGRTTTYAYDAGGLCTARRTPTGARSSRTHDAAGRLLRLETDAGTLHFAHDAAGRPTAIRIGGGAEISRSYDLRGRCTTQQVSGSRGAALAESYSYSTDSGLTTVTDAHSRTAPTVLARDAAGRVTSVRTAYGSEEYAYDAAGGQVRATWPALYGGQEATGPREYAGTRLVRAGAVRYEHDALGRVVLRQASGASGAPDVWRYTWDAGDHLTSVTAPDGAVWHYAYDPLGRRTSKRRMASDGREPAEEKLFTWDGPRLCEEIIRPRAADTTVVLTWDYSGDTVVCQTERVLDRSGKVLDTRFFAVVTSGSDAPVALVDESGFVAWRARCTITGLTAWAAGGSAFTPLRMCGRYEDPESRLQIGLAGAYDPQTAQYLTPATRPAAAPHRPETAAEGAPLPCPAECRARVPGVPHAERCVRVGRSSAVPPAEGQASSSSSGSGRVGGGSVLTCLCQ